VRPGLALQIVAGCGQLRPALAWLRPAVASCGRLWCGRAWLSCGRTWLWCGRTWPSAAGPGQARPALHRCFGALLYGSFVHCYSHICVPTSKNTNTTRGTLLVSKMCMKLVVYASRTRGFDGQIFVVRTVNKPGR
jgi:hypothetical protein